MSTYEDPQKAIEAGGQALHGFPWYNPANDGLKRLEVRQHQSTASFRVNPVLDPLIYCGALAVLAVVLIALVFMILRAMRLRKLPSNRGELSMIGEAGRIEALPFPVAHANLSLLDQARDFYQAGNYARAIICLFSHQLVQLDRHQIIRLAKGKTNRQYLREVGQADSLRQLVGQTLVAFEDVFFGHHAIDRERFEACWSRLPEFELLLVAPEKASAKYFPPQFHSGILLALTALALDCSLGCRKELQTVYGQRSGPGATESINGTAVFADMFATAGHRVSSWNSLSPRLDQADCVVWFPDDFVVPSPDVVKWFERWLRARPNRTLIYVGRDFDAAPWYWRKIQSAAPVSEQAEIGNLCKQAELAFQNARQSKQRTAACRWFSVRYNAPRSSASNVNGDIEWLQNIDSSQWEVELNSRISPRLDMEALLESDEGLILGRLDVGQSQLLVAANGSFLVNAMLVNREHRKLAGKLVDAIGRSARDVVFLESGQIKLDEPTDPAVNPLPDPFAPVPANDSTRPQQQGSANGPPIRGSDPAPDASNGLEFLLVWPTNWILLHFAAIGILFCFWKLPIFGLPRPEDPTNSADFGRHIDAVAALLQRTADRRYALSRVRHYQQIVRKTN